MYREDPPRRSRNKTNSFETRKYIAKVYLYVCFGLGIFGLSVYGTIEAFKALFPDPYDTELVFFILSICMFVVFLVGGLGCLFLAKERYFLKLLCFVLVAASIGVELSFVLDVTHKVDPNVLWVSAGMTVCTVVLLTPIAFFVKRKTIFFLSGLLMVLFLGGIFFSFANIFVGSRSVYMLVECVFLVAFSLALVVYTYFIIVDKEGGNDDIIQHAYLLFVAVVNIFITLVRINMF
ncbi:MAG: uncharacterized protein A8A55_0957 [Amphiamblys sp. WSBS2006]|nr:MAG: uncharacterized protein A8A55_0957 [Amphiamblys sp. WSBS2006]